VADDLASGDGGGHEGVAVLVQCEQRSHQARRRRGDAGEEAQRLSVQGQPGQEAPDPLLVAGAGRADLSSMHRLSLPAEA